MVGTAGLGGSPSDETESVDIASAISAPKLSSMSGVGARFRALEVLAAVLIGDFDFLLRSLPTEGREMSDSEEDPAEACKIRNELMRLVNRMHKNGLKEKT